MTEPTEPAAATTTAKRPRPVRTGPTAAERKAMIEQLQAYAPLVETLLAALAFPVISGETSVRASDQPNLDDDVRDAVTATAIAVLASVRRTTAHLSGESA